MSNILKPKKSERKQKFRGLKRGRTPKNQAMENENPKKPTTKTPKTIKRRDEENGIIPHPPLKNVYKTSKGGTSNNQPNGR